jgi:hypothetical protein
VCGCVGLWVYVRGEGGEGCVCVWVCGCMCGARGGRGVCVYVLVETTHTLTAVHTVLLL